MDFDKTAFPTGQAVTSEELTKSNRVSQKFGLVLSPTQADMLAQRQAEALRETGRIEFCNGILKKLALVFCDSPFIQPEDWADTLAQLQTIFYELKNETKDRLGDDDLLFRMAARFNGTAGGSLDALESTPPEWFFRPGAEYGWEAEDEL